MTTAQQATQLRTAAQREAEFFHKSWSLIKNRNHTSIDHNHVNGGNRLTKSNCRMQARMAIESLRPWYVRGSDNQPQSYADAE